MLNQMHAMYPEIENFVDYDKGDPNDNNYPNYNIKENFLQYFQLKVAKNSWKKSMSQNWFVFTIEVPLK